MKAEVCSGRFLKLVIFAECASQGYLGARIGVHGRTLQFTGPMIGGRVLRCLPGEAPRFIYATFIHLWN
jgi:hypothetical protein